MPRSPFARRAGIRPAVFVTLLALPILPLMAAPGAGQRHVAAAFGTVRTDAGAVGRRRLGASAPAAGIAGHVATTRLLTPTRHGGTAASDGQRGTRQTIGVKAPVLRRAARAAGALPRRHRAAAIPVVLPVAVAPQPFVVPHVATYFPSSPTSPFAPPSPPVLARSAFLYDVTAGRVLYARNAAAHLPMASTTKIMTALLGIMNGHLDDWVTPSITATTIGESSMYLRQGERLRMRDLLYGLLLPSGNDASIAIAEHVGGSDATFVAMMNREATALGMTDTHYANPHGLDAPGHYTSARDLAVLAMAAMRLPLFRQIVATRYYNIPATAHNVEHDLVNINQPLWWYPGTMGIKPGTTDAAGRCAVEWVKRGNHEVLLVVLDDVNLVTDVRNLFNWGFGDFSRWYSPLLAPVVYASEYFGWDGPGLWLPTPDGARYYARSGHLVRPPMLAPYLLKGGLVRFGPPTSEQFRAGVLWAQRFAGTWLFYNPRTHRLASRAQQVE